MAKSKRRAHPAKLAERERAERAAREERSRRGLVIRAASRNPVIAEMLKREREGRLSD